MHVIYKGRRGIGMLINKWVIEFGDGTIVMAELDQVEIVWTSCLDQLKQYDEYNNLEE